MRNAPNIFCAFIGVALVLALAGCAGKAGEAAAAAAATKSASSVAEFNGDWTGALGSGATQLKLRLVLADGGALLDVPAQGVKAYPAEAVALVNGRLKVDFTVFKASCVLSLSSRSDGLVGSWLQGGGLTAFTMDKTPPAAPEAPEPGEALSFPSAAAGVVLAGTLRLPEGAGPFPAVVLISGSGPQNRDEEVMGIKPFRDLAAALAAAGWASLRYDDRGVGGSSGSFAGSLVADFAADAVGAYRALAADRRIDPRRIVLAGHSEGAHAALLAENLLGGCAGVAMLAGAGRNGSAVLLEQSADLMKASGASAAQIDAAAKANAAIYGLLAGNAVFPRAAVEAELKKAGLSDDALAGQLAVLGDPWFVDFLTADPAAALAKLKSPLLALNGSKDLQVRAATNLPVIAAAALAAGIRATTRELPGLNHLFQSGAVSGLPAEYANLGGVDPSASAALVAWLVALPVRPAK